MTSSASRAWLEGARLALGFGTRLLPVPVLPPEEFAQAARDSLAWFPAAGLLLGGMLTACAWLTSPLGEVRGWLLAGLGFWLTRGLHWDGLADLADAWGANASGERFWSICKDSRVGAFGVAALVLGLGGSAALQAACLERGGLAAILLAPMLGRGLMLAAMAWWRPLARPGLGAAFYAGATPRRCLTALGACLAVSSWLLSPGHAGLFMLLGGLLLWQLRRLAHRAGGVNGDFLGAAVTLGELAALSTWLLTTELG